ncbi:DNA mismatch repair protein MutS [Beggiatoa leptomitoformis]|uniref:DNA mismatch repair protein MutS n=2 Tax=Beggiatoa leptomitoformis TaxID=288004 RepID=A0A2N9YHD7_9GAMM|nr:DNA mismatch repair protein MutS [Beggiatoa leptomitoformis]AUI69942.2 DNA mismatch repair protein MutS [Beggiatoa leptomitoformis]
MQQSGVKPNPPANRVLDTSPRPRPIPRQRFLEDAQVKEDMLSDAYDPAELETGEELLFLRSGIQQTLFRRLRRGQLSIETELDLHGMTVPIAREAIAEFLHYCQSRNIRCARIIHGKGYGSWQKQPILKIKVNHWLRQRDEVLAFCSARPVDGGTGAVYVLLKRG